MAHPNEELVRNGYDAFARGDLDAVLRIFDEDIRWHVGGRHPLAGDYRGREEVSTFFTDLFERSGGTFSAELHDILGNDEHVVALVIVRAEREGRRFGGMSAHVWHVGDGKAVEFWTCPADPVAVDEFWA